MKVLLISNSNPYFHNTNYYRLRAVKALGHEVAFFDVNTHVLHPRLRQTWPYFESLDSAIVNDRLIGVAQEQRPDVCLVVGGVEVSIQSVERIRALGIRCVLWTSDPPHPQYFANVIKVAPLYNAVFCAGTEAIELLAASGFNKAQWLPFACDPLLHCPVDLTEEDRREYQRQITFVGSYYPNRWEIFESLVEFSPGIWGPGWQKGLKAARVSPLARFIDDRRVDYYEWLKMYSAADIVLVVHYQDGKIPCYQASPKLFEAMASGAFVMCDSQRDAAVLFRDGEHLAFFSDPQDLKQKVRYYLSHPEERLRIAAAGRAEVIAQHRYEHRITRLLEGSGRV